ncbi:MAG: hypothetical protein GY797_18160 [Deltaproteobacteria bacterium]|nr:hypothetical protein [Deltaproteobacteria bacterium]
MNILYLYPDQIANGQKSFEEIEFRDLPQAEALEASVCVVSNNKGLLKVLKNRHGKLYDALPIDNARGIFPKIKDAIDKASIAAA